MRKTKPFLLYGLTSEMKDGLRRYAIEKLGTTSRTKAILHLVGNLTLTNQRYSFHRVKLDEKKKRLQFSLRESDYNNLLEVANMTDCSIQYLLVSIVLKELYKEQILTGEIIQELRKSNYELHKIGININQIAKALNSGEASILTSDLLKKLETHIELVKNLLQSKMEKY